MSEPKFCYLCNDIVTFCGCESSITNESEAIEHFRGQATAIQEEIAALKKSRNREAAAYDKLQNAFIDLNLELDECRERISALEKVAEAATEWFGPSLQDARFETVAIIKALREAGYTYTTQEESK